MIVPVPFHIGQTVRIVLGKFAGMDGILEGFVMGHTYPTHYKVRIVIDGQEQVFRFREGAVDLHPESPKRHNRPN